ncbi:MAG: tetratricopeptide repeat protein [Chthoniobacter sp.]
MRRGLGNRAPLEPGNALFHYNLGYTRQRQRHWEAAIAAYRTALLLQPATPCRGSIWACLSPRRIGPREAIAAYRAGRQHHPGDYALGVNLADALRDQGHLDEAIALYERMVDAPAARPSWPAITWPSFSTGPSHAPETPAGARRLR